jgi:hypothetical protein
MTTSIDFSRRRALAVFGALLTAGLSAPAASAAQTTGKTTKTAKSKRGAHKASKSKQGTSEAETQKQKDARLTRECRGRPNAGACLGYAN